MIQNGLIDFEEFAVEYVRQQVRKVIFERFQATDSDGDGEIDRKELLDMLVEELG